MADYRNTTSIRQQTGAEASNTEGGFWEEVGEITGGGDDSDYNPTPPSTNTGAIGGSEENLDDRSISDDETSLNDAIDDATGGSETAEPLVIVDSVTSDSDPIRGATHTATVTVSKPFFADPGSVELTMTVDGKPVDDRVFIYSVSPSGSGSVNVTYNVPDSDSYTIGFEEVGFSKTLQTVADPSNGGGGDNGDGGAGGSPPDDTGGKSPINGRNLVILGGLTAGAVALSQLGGD